MRLGFELLDSGNQITLPNVGGCILTVDELNITWQKKRGVVVVGNSFLLLN